jgi:fructose-1,6-bisphosphatase/inositol monophosphatase family enzyme
VAAGRADIMIDAVVAPYDIAALQVILAEAGGQLTDFTGRANIYGHNAVSTNGRLHEAVIDVLARDLPTGKPE